jgi:HEAT repeat protein
MHEPNRLLQSASLFLVLLIAIASAFAQASPANSQELATLVEDLQSTNDDIRRTAGNSLFERLESDYQMMVTMLVPITSSSSEQTRYDSAKLLFAGSLLSVGNAQIATSLISTYRSLALDTSARVSVVGIEAFSFLPGGTPASETEILISLLSHPETKNSVAATMTLGSLPQPTPEVAQALLTVMNTTDDELKRAAAAEALGELRVSDALVVSGLIALLSDNDLGVRQQAATALGRIGSASISALPALRAMAEQDPDPTIRLIAASAATAIENANSPPPSLPMSLRHRHPIQLL